MSLKQYYNRIYLNREKGSHTKLCFGRGMPDDAREILKEMKWSGKTVVDAGCGTGLLTYHLARRGARVIGIDFAENAIKVARKKYKHPNLEFRCMNIKKLTGEYDAIVSLGMLEHLDLPLMMLRQFKSLVKRGGSIVIVCPNWTNPRGYILLPLWYLLRMPITRTDKHYFTPIEFEKWARELNLDIEWRTFNHSWAHGERLIRDLKRRIPKVLPSDTKKYCIDTFIKWIEEHIVPLDHRTKFSGASGLYHFRKIRG